MAGSLGIVLVLVLFVLIIYKRANNRKLKLADLNTKVRELELKAIRAQMNPHFMYNCLNSIQSLVQQKKSEEAHAYISRFATLIRNVLKFSDKGEISLAEELELIETYVSLEKLRFDFDFEIEKDEKPDLFSIFIPPLLLQPFIENAINHGLIHKEGNRKLIIRINTIPGYICIVIEDDGVGRKASQKNGKNTTGKGLVFSKERLELMKEKQQVDYKMNITDMEDDKGNPMGTKVEICISEE